MSPTRTVNPVRWLAGAAGLAAASYAALAGIAWIRYGRPCPSRDDARDGLLDRFMPAYDVVERHHVRVAAPAEVTFEAARDQELLDLPLVSAIFRAREVAMGGTNRTPAGPRGLLAQTLSLGWGVLAEVPGREVVVGTVTQPWKADVVFRALPPVEFAAFNAPGFVKIVWTLRADPTGPDTSIFRTETRAVATDAEARRRFRRYWAFASPGIALIRWLSLVPLRRDAERRAQSESSRPVTAPPRLAPD